MYGFNETSETSRRARGSGEQRDLIGRPIPDLELRYRTREVLRRPGGGLHGDGELPVGVLINRDLDCATPVGTRGDTTHTSILMVGRVIMCVGTPPL